MRNMLYGVVVSACALTAHASSYTYQQPVSCLMKDNVCISYKPTQGPIINNGAKPWFYPEQGKDYAQVAVGASKTLTFLVANVGTGPLTVYGFDKGSLSDTGMTEALASVKYSPSAFMFTKSDCPTDDSFVLGVNATCTLSVKYLPSAAGEVGDVIKMLHSSAEVSAVVQDIRGTGVATPKNANPGSDGMPTTGGLVDSPVSPNPDVSPEMAKTALSLSAGSLNFGQVAKGAVTAPLSIVLTNLLDEQLAFSSKRIANGWFKFTDNCGTTLPAKGSCTFQFTMDTSKVIKPSSIDTFTVDFKEGASTKVGLSGTVMGTEVSASPNPAEVVGYVLDQDIDTSLVLTNSGTAPASITNFSITDTPQGKVVDLGGFVSDDATAEVDSLGGFGGSPTDLVRLKSHSCASIPANSNCEVVVGIKSATEVSTVKYLNYELEGQIYSVKINAKVAEADIAVSPSTLDWGVVPFYSSTEKVLTLTNVGGKSVSGVSAVLPPLFSIKSTSCTDTLAVGATCSLSIAYSPVETMAANTVRGASIANNGDIKSIPFKVKGGGEGPVVVASTTSLTLGKVNPTAGYPSASFTLKNVGTTSATISGVSVDADTYVIQSNTCGASLAAGASCSVAVQLNTSTNGVAKGNVVVATSSLKNANLKLPITAEVNGAILSAKPDRVSFGEVAYGTSHVKTSTITNEGNMPVKLLTVRAISDRIDVNATCRDDMVLAPKETCTVSFSFDAGLGAKNMANAVVEIVSDAAKNGLSLSASGIAKGSYLEAPTSANAPLTRVGSFAYATATLTNQGYQPLSLTNVALNSAKPDASQWSEATHNCTNVGYQQSCTIRAKFTPSSYGTKYGEIQFNSNDVRVPSGSISLVGDGMEGDIAFYVDGTLNKSFNFGRIPFNTLSSKSIVMTNVGLQTTRVLTGSASNANWSISGCVGQSLAPQASCVFNMATTSPFASGAEVSAASDFTFTFDKATSTSFRATYSAAGAWPSVSGNVSFDGKTPYNISKTKTVTITNVGNRPLEIAAWSVQGDSAGQVALDTSSCNSAIPMNGTCTVSVTYTAKAEGVLSATVVAQTNTNTRVYSPTAGEIKFTVAGDSASALPKLSVNMTGSVSPVTRTLYLYNAGSAGLTLQSGTLSMTQGSASLPKGITTCPALAANSYCAIPVTFQGASLAGSFNIHITGAAGSDGNGTFSLPLGVDASVYPISANEDFDFPGAHPTASPWYSGISYGNASSDGNFATYNVSTELALGSGPVLRFRTGYGQSINKVVAYVKNVKPYILDLGVYNSSDTNSGHSMTPLAKVAVPAYYEGFVTINFPEFTALASAPTAWPALDKSWALQATEQGMTVGRYMIIYEFRVGKTP